MPTLIRLAAAVLCLASPGLATPGLANDGFGGLNATGLTFSQTDAVAMQEEDLFIGIDRITVDYVFRNLTAADVTGEVIFPLPPIAVWSTLDSNWNLPTDVDRANLVDFRAVVDGTEVPVSIDRIAVIEPDWVENRPLAEQYDTPGQDVTADLARFGLPLSLDAMKVTDALLALSPADRAEVKALNLAEYYDEDTAAPQAYPHWSIVLRYHWTQTFPANAEVKISHDYENRPAGGLFNWTDPPDDWMLDVVNRYCIDAGTSKALANALKHVDEDGTVTSWGTSWNIAYVLRTANSWAGPIGKFRLTIDKGAPEHIVSLCADGIKKTGPTTFVMEKTNFTPERDLEILVAAPMSP